MQDWPAELRVAALPTQQDVSVRQVTEGPLEGCLKLKVPQCPPPHMIECSEQSELEVKSTWHLMPELLERAWCRYTLHVGSVCRGPFLHNFGESTVNGSADFGIDWLQQAREGWHDFRSILSVP